MVNDTHTRRRRSRSLWLSDVQNFAVLVFFCILLFIYTCGNNLLISIDVLVSREGFLIPVGQLVGTLSAGRPGRCCAYPHPPISGTHVVSGALYCKQWHSNPNPNANLTLTVTLILTPNLNRNSN